MNNSPRYYLHSCWLIEMGLFDLPVRCRVDMVVVLVVEEEEDMEDSKEEAIK